jgi:NADH:ubiquinone reductase (H+-translocating)
MAASGRKPHVVIIGGGFGGLNAARALRDAPVDITIIDRRNHHVFQPLLYQVATASLSPADIAQPIRAIFRNQDNVTTVLLAEANSVDLAGKRIILDEGEISYDYLVIATGARHAYFGHDEWEPLAPGLKSLEDALEIRRRVLVAFEEAERTDDEYARNRLMTFVVVGGGPTGAELAGALGEISRQTLAREYDRIDPTWARIYLFEAGPRILSTFPESLANKAVKYLNSLGVQVRTGTAVTEISTEGVVAGDKMIPVATVLWAAGVVASSLARTLDVPLDRNGRVIVQPDLTIAGYPDAFVVGDLAALAGEDGRQLPGVAQVAIQQGQCAARSIVHSLHGEPLETFQYVDKGNMATIGRNKAVADIRGIRLSGFVAWVAWLWIHIFYLIGFRNRLGVMLNWAWSYVTYNRGARLITKTGFEQTREIIS